MQDSDVPKRGLPRPQKVVDMITTEREKREKGWRCPKCRKWFKAKFTKAMHLKTWPKCAEVD